MRLAPIFRSLKSLMKVLLLLSQIKHVLLGETFAQSPAFLIAVIDILRFYHFCSCLPVSFFKFKPLISYPWHTISQFTVEVLVSLGFIDKSRRDCLTSTFKLALLLFWSCSTTIPTVLGRGHWSCSLGWILRVIYYCSWIVCLTTWSAIFFIDTRSLAWMLV